MRKLTSTIFAVAAAATLFSLNLAQSQQKSAPKEDPDRDLTKTKGYGTHFQTSDRCVACHKK